MQDEASEVATEEVLAEAEWPLNVDDEGIDEGVDERMLAVLAAAEQFPSEHVKDGLAEAYALWRTPLAEQSALRAYASSSNDVAPVVSLPTQTSGSWRARRELRAA